MKTSIKLMLTGLIFSSHLGCANASQSEDYKLVNMFTLTKRFTKICENFIEEKGMNPKEQEYNIRKNFETLNRVLGECTSKKPNTESEFYLYAGRGVYKYNCNEMIDLFVKNGILVKEANA